MRLLVVAWTYWHYTSGADGSICWNMGVLDIDIEYECYGCPEFICLERRFAIPGGI